MTATGGAGAPQDSWAILRSVIVLFGLLLGSNVALTIWSVYGIADPWAEVVVAGFDAAVVVAWVIQLRGTIGPMLHPAAVRAVHWVLAAALMLAMYGFMWGYLSLALLLFDEVELLEDYRAHGWPLWSVFVLVAVVPPLVEELAFRGYILDRLGHLMPARDANLLQAALFSILHCNVAILPSHFVLGLVFGWLRLRSRSLLPGIVLHALWNALVVVEELARDGWG